MKAALQDVIKYLVLNAKYPPTKTSLIKLIYLADYYHWQLYGSQLTDCEYKLWRYGVFCPDISDTAERISEKGMLKISRILYPSAYQVMYEPIREATQDINLATEQIEVLESVINKHSGQTLPELKRSHYETEPMQNVSNRGERLNMNCINRKVKIKENSRIKSLQSHIKGMKLSVAKSPKETAEHYKGINASLENVRKRANTAQIRGM